LTLTRAWRLAFLSAFAGLGPLRHLDLQFLRAGEIFAGDAEAAAGDLFDGATAPVAVGVGHKAGRILAPFARVALAAQAVHGDGQGLVGFARNGTVGHGAGGEPLDDRRGRLDFVQRHGLLGGLELQ
jgi:hypothetical protein